MVERSDTAAAATVPGAGRRMAIAGAATLSLLLHAWGLVAALDWLERSRSGAIQRPSDAISVELVASAALDAVQPKKPAEPAPAPQPTAPVTGSPKPSDATPAPKPEPEPEPEPQPEPEPESEPERESAKAPAAPSATDADSPDEPAEAPVAPPVETKAPPETVPKTRKAKAKAEEAQPKRRQVKKKERQRRKSRRRVRKGGVTSKARAGRGKGSARASASRGAILRYADRVRARVAANRPSGGTPGGTALVAFGLTPSGRLAYVRIARSSGNRANDRIAIAAVRGAAPFPRPPRGATRRQLRFNFYYRFR